MSPHFLVFVGPSPTLSAELATLKRSYEYVQVITVVGRKDQRGVSPITISLAMEALATRVQSIQDVAGLSVWSYHDQSAFRLLWESFGRFAWVEIVPQTLVHKDRPTRLHIQHRIPVVIKLLHEISHDVYNRRKSSPLPLPLRNFQAGVTLLMQDYWYAETDLSKLKRTLQGMDQQFRQVHRTTEGAHSDARNLLFSPAKDAECHGLARSGVVPSKCYLGGRFRFGASLFNGFHYDVRKVTGTLDCTLFDCMGVARDMGPERRRHINIFPNDALLPLKPRV